MNVLIDIGHPGHVHLFRPFAQEMQKKGHSVLFTCREKEFEIELLKAAGFEYISFGKKFSGIPGKIYGLLKFGIQEFKAALKFEPDIILSHGSPYAAHASFLLRKPHVSFEDTFNFEQIKLYKPFTEVILTSDYEHPLKSDKVFKYSGYHELAYLHPSRFKPDPKVLNQLGIKKGEKFVIVRFVSWEASHDFGHKGISLENKLKAVHEFSKHAKVFISSEKELQKELKEYQLKIPPSEIHSIIAYSSLVFGESATMATEGAMLGIPGVYLDNVGRYYTRDIANKYELLFNYSESEEDQLNAIQKGVELLSEINQHGLWNEKRKKLLNDKIDVTAFLVWFIENWPESKQIMLDNPDYQDRFR